jgi:hypothetical protein
MTTNDPTLNAICQQLDERSRLVSKWLVLTSSPERELVDAAHFRHDLARHLLAFGPDWLVMMGSWNPHHARSVESLCLLAEEQEHEIRMLRDALVKSNAQRNEYMTKLSKSCPEAH